MAFTIEQYNSLENAYSKGILTVEYSDKKVTYRSRQEMKDILKEMRVELGLSKPNNQRRYAKYKSGY